MVDLALLQSVSYIVGALGVCVAAIYYMMNLQITRRKMKIAGASLIRKTNEGFTLLRV
jgi:hypothetical protein